MQADPPTASQLFPALPEQSPGQPVPASVGTAVNAVSAFADRLAMALGDSAPDNQPTTMIGQPISAAAQSGNPVSPSVEMQQAGATSAHKLSNSLAAMLPQPMVITDAPASVTPATSASASQPDPNRSTVPEQPPVITAEATVQPLPVPVPDPSIGSVLAAMPEILAGLQCNDPHASSGKRTDDASDGTVRPAMPAHHQAGASDTTVVAPQVTMVQPIVPIALPLPNAAVIGPQPGIGASRASTSDSAVAAAKAGLTVPLPVSSRSADQPSRLPTELNTLAIADNSSATAAAATTVQPAQFDQFNMASQALPVGVDLAQAAAPVATPTAASQPAATAHTTLASPASQVAPALVSLAHAPDGAQRLTLRLDPPELGQVQIRIDRPQDAPARVEITVQKPETLTLLLRDQPQLQRALDQAGVPPDGRSVTFHMSVAEPAARSDGPLTLSSGTDVAGQMGNGSHGASRQGGSPQQQANNANSDGDTEFTPIPLPTWLRVGLDITA